MEVKKFFLNQDDLGAELRKIVDSYLEHETSEDDLKKLVKEIVENNREKYFSSEGKIAVRVKRKLGKKRILIISKILDKGE